MERQWKVGDLARITGLTIRTLRYYDQIGLFSPTGHSESGHRLYSEADVQQLQRILSLRDLGLSLEEVQDVLNGNACTPAEIVSIQIDRLQRSIRVQQKLLVELEKIADLMDLDKPLSVETFLNVLEMMKQKDEKYAIRLRIGWERKLDRLGGLFKDDDPPQSREGQEDE